MTIYIVSALLICFISGNAFAMHLQTIQSKQTEQPYQVASSYLELFNPGKLSADITCKVQMFVSGGDTLVQVLEQFKKLKHHEAETKGIASLANFYPLYPAEILQAVKGRVFFLNECFLKQGNYGAVRLLVDLGVNFFPWARECALGEFQSHQDQSVCFRYLKLLHLIESALERKETVCKFIKAAKEGKLIEVQSFIDQGVPINGQGPYRTTALIEASQAGHAEVVDTLLKHKASVNIKDEHRSFALIEAASNGHDVIVHKLLQAGADPLQRIEGYIDVISYAKNSNIRAMLEEAEDQKRKTQELFEHAAESGTINEVKRLLAAGVVVDGIAPKSGQNKKMNALQRAAKNGQVEVVKILLDSGATINYTYQYNRYHDNSPLGLSLENGHNNVTTLLLARGVPVTQSHINQAKRNNSVLTNLLELINQNQNLVTELEKSCCNNK